MIKYKVKKGDRVLVIAGENKGSEGKILSVLRNKNKAIVEGINIVKRHIKPNTKNPNGTIEEKEMPIHISNLSLMTKAGEPTRVGYKMDGDKKVRYAKKTGELI